MKKSFLSLAVMASAIFATNAWAEGETTSSFENCYGAEGCQEMSQYDYWSQKRGKIYYTIEDNKMVIYGATSTDGNGNPGNDIVQYQFASNKNLTGITEIKFAGNVEIGPLAFQQATNLTSVDLSGVQTIGMSAFSGASNIANINLTGVQTISYGAFSGIKNLENLDLKGIQTVGDSAFYNSNIGNINIEDVASIGDRAFSWSGAASPTNLGNINIKNVNSIGASAFYGVEMENLSLENVETIGDRAFNHIQNLDTLNLVGIGSIDTAAFNQSTINTVNIKDVETVKGFYYANVENVTLENVQTIGASAFYKVTGLKTLDLNGVKEIGGSAFYDSSIENIDLTGVTKIGSYAFQSCSNLTSLVIPDTVESMGTNAFYNVAPTDLTISSDKIAMFLMAEGRYSNINNLYCSDGAEACKNVFKALMRGGGGIPGCNRSFSCSATDTSGFCFSILNSIKDAPIPSEERKLADGSVALYRDGKLVGFRGKRIYTVEEASMLSKDTGNTIKLRYK